MPRKGIRTMPCISCLSIARNDQAGQISKNRKGTYVTLELIYLSLWNIIMQDHHMLLQSIKMTTKKFDLVTYWLIVQFLPTLCPTMNHCICSGPWSNFPTNTDYGKSAYVSLKSGNIGFTKTLTAWSCCDLILLVAKHQLNLWVCREHGWWLLSVL